MKLRPYNVDNLKKKFQDTFSNFWFVYLSYLFHLQLFKTIFILSFKIFCNYRFVGNKSFTFFELLSKDVILTSKKFPSTAIYVNRDTAWCLR